MGNVVLHVYFDGSYGPHGATAYGFVVKNEESEVIHSQSGYVGRGKSMSSNVGEYEGLYQAMLYIQQWHPTDTVTFSGDSTLVIRQMRGESQAKGGKYLPYYLKTIDLANPFIDRKQWRFRWIQRSLNSEADDLAQYHRF